MSGPDVRPSKVPTRTVRGLLDRLGESVAHLTGVDVGGSAVVPGGIVLSGVALDSRRVRPGDLYAALAGQRDHGARHALQAVDAGAAAILTDAQGRLMVDAMAATSARLAEVPTVVVPDPRGVLGDVASWVYDDPSHHMDVIGITGTNGKTTTAYLIAAGLEAAGLTPGLIGTVETRIGSESIPSVRTTPEAPDLQALLAVMRERGVRAVAMEVSSHSLELGRVAGTQFAVGAFTNLSQDHLDFHGSLEEYFAAKARLFDGPSRDRVVCVDDEWGRRLATAGAVTVTTTGRDGAHWFALHVRTHRLGVSFTLQGPGLAPTPVSVPLPGAFNAANAALAIASLARIGVDPLVAIRGVERLGAVPGRMERVEAGQPFLAVVDYAHTPDAVASLLESLRDVTEGRLTVVLGCGGDRDPDKREAMGAAAATWADRVIVTDDNPRSEDPAAIRSRVLAGAYAVARDGSAAAGRSPGSLEGPGIDEIGDRRAAIEAAVATAGPKDTVVLAGKGHEQGQDTAGVVRPFDDRSVLREAIATSAANRSVGGGPSGSRPGPAVEGGRQ